MDVISENMNGMLRDDRSDQMMALDLHKFYLLTITLNWAAASNVGNIGDGKVRSPGPS